MNMAKSQEELNQIKIEYENLTTELKELSEEELSAVAGGLEQKTSLRALFPVIFANNQTSTNLENIEKINILKDASCTAIYGSKGSN